MHRADPFGCHADPAVPLSESYPGRFGGYEIPYCPFRLLRQPDPLRDAIVEIAQDYRAGVVRGWPDRYSSGVVDGVRFVLRESDAAQAAAMTKAVG